MSDITSPVNVPFLVPHALVSKCSVSIFLQEHQDVLPLHKHRAFGVLIAVTLLSCQCYEPQCVQRAMAVLAFKADTQCGPYKHLFEEQQWQSLVELFYQELYRLNNLTPQSVLAVHLQVRLCAVCCLLSSRCCSCVHQIQTMPDVLKACRRCRLAYLHSSHPLSHPLLVRKILLLLRWVPRLLLLQPLIMPHSPSGELWL